MKVYALTVMKNEAHRYLANFLTHHAGMFDGHAFYDDQSTDQSVEMCEAAGGKVFVRIDSDPAFLEVESEFRNDAWNWMEDCFNPDVKDWIVVLDADEFLTGPVNNMIEKAMMLDSSGISISVPEVFTVDNGTPWVRTDGFWGDLRSTRVCRYQRPGQYAYKEMGASPVPEFANRWVYAPDQPTTPAILHYGYARHEDRLAKYERYKNLSGHNPAHIESIMQKPTLEQWTGSYPVIT